jgi:phage terminase small subunit
VPKLTNKQELFIAEYCIDCNASRAAIAAGYAKDSAKEMGYENLTKPHVASKVRQRLLEMASRAEITAGSVLRELALMAFADMGQYNSVDEDGAVRLDFRGMGPDGMRAVKKIKQEVMMIGDANDRMPILKTEFELYDKQVALDKLMRYMGLYAKDNKRELAVDLAVREMEPVPRANDMKQWLANRESVTEHLEAIEKETA